MVIIGFVFVVALFVITHTTLFRAPDTDPAYGGDRSPDGRPALLVARGIRYEMHIREGLGQPGTCVMVTEKGAVHPLTLDRMGGSPVEDDGVRYAWVGSFRSPADGWVAIDCDRGTSIPLRVQADAPGLLTLGFLVFAAPVVFLVAVVLTVVVWSRRRRSRTQSFVRPPTLHLDAEPVERVRMARELLDGERQTHVLFRRGTIVSAGERTGSDAVVFATDRLRAVAPGDDYTVTAVQDGWLVTYPGSELRVHITSREAKHTSTSELGDCARAKLRMDARRPTILEVYQPKPDAAPPVAPVAPVAPPR